MRMSGPASRRGFLSGLVSLPLIGGGVTLIGSPSAVALPASRLLLSEYANWLAHERFRAFVELNGTDKPDWYTLQGAAYRWHREHSGGAPWHGDGLNMPPSTRAALVLSAVGCDWREGGR